MFAESNISCSLRALYFFSCAQVTAGSNVLGSISAVCYKFYEQVTTGANAHIISYVSYHFCCAKVAAEAITIFLLVYFIIDFVRK